VPEEDLVHPAPLAEAEADLVAVVAEEFPALRVVVEAVDLAVAAGLPIRKLLQH
jgi:hypothetical protein